MYLNLGEEGAIRLEGVLAKHHAIEAHPRIPREMKHFSQNNKGPVN